MKILALFIMAFSYSNMAFTQDTSLEVKRLYKCYALFVDQRIKEDDPLLLDVKKNKLSGTEACMKLLEKASLSGSGLTSDQEIGPQILKKLLRFYQEQLSNPSFATAAGGSGVYGVTNDVTDRNEPSYHYLYALFNQGEDFSQLVTRDYSFKAIRYSNKAERKRTIANTNAYNLQKMDTTLANRCKETLALMCAETQEDTGKLPAYIKTLTDTHRRDTLKHCENLPLYQSYCDEFIWEGNAIQIKNEVKNYTIQVPRIALPDSQIAKPFYPEFVETGKLLGLEPDNRVSELSVTAGIANYTSPNIHNHLGAGLIGTQAYLLGNMSFLTGALNGTTKVQRRFGVNVFADLLCRPNPALRSTDVIEEVIATSSIPFRQGISCMGCHAGMDKLAGVARNFTLVGSHNSGVRHGRIGFMAQRKLTSPQEAKRVMLGTTAAISNYHLTAPIGQLNYRSYDGTRVQVDLENLEDLGEKIAQTNDFYVCAAKRHFKFLTGIEVDLSDEGDMNSPKLTEKEQFYRDRVIKLGLDLKKHQSLKELFKAIISTPTFIQPDRGV